jgi:guanylate kinase
LHGVNYHFSSKDEMEEMSQSGEFLECCQVHVAHTLVRANSFRRTVIAVNILLKTLTPSVPDFQGEQEASDTAG